MADALSDIRWVSPHTFLTIHLLPIPLQKYVQVSRENEFYKTSIFELTLPNFTSAQTLDRQLCCFQLPGVERCQGQTHKPPFLCTLHKQTTSTTKLRPIHSQAKTHTSAPIIYTVCSFCMPCINDMLSCPPAKLTHIIQINNNISIHITIDHRQYQQQKPHK